MKNFDTSRKHNHTPVEDRTFVLGGEEFVAKEDIHPSVLTSFDRLDDANVSKTLDVIDETILALMVPDDDAEARYRKVRANMEDPITLETMVEVSRWLVEISSGRPTGPPSGSEPGRNTTEMPSTAVSSLPVTPTASAA